MCVILEIRSKITGRSSARLPASRSVQSLAACLVGAALAISTMGRVAAVPKADGVRAASAARVAQSGHDFAPGASSLMPLRVIDDLVPIGHSIGSGHRSGGLAATDSASASPVVGEPPDGDGASGGSDSRGVLTLGPTPGVEQSALGGHELPPVRPTHLVAPRETLWSIAEARLGSPLRWKEIAELNYDIRQGDGQVLTAEHSVRPGWTLALPKAAGRISASAERGSIVRLHEGKVPLMPVGCGIVGSGVVGLIDRMRRVQQRHRSEGTYIRLPDRTQSRFEQRLRLGDGLETVQVVDAAVRLLVQAWSDARPDPPSVTGITVHSDSIELMVDRMDGHEALPSSFRPDAGRRSVSVDRAFLRAGELDGSRTKNAVPPAPLLVSAGHGAEGLIMVNVESLGTLSVLGDPARCDGVVRALALELATSYWAGWFDLNVVGFGAELERFDRVVSVTDVPMLLDRMHRRRLEGEELLRESGFRSYSQARTAASTIRWDPVAIICGPTVAEADVAELVDLASGSLVGMAVITSGTSGGGQHVLNLTETHRSPSLEPLGSVLSPQQVELDELDEVTALLDTAMNRQSVLVSEEPYLNLPVAVPQPIESDGSPDAVGGEHPLGRTGNVRGTQDRGIRDESKEYEVEVAVLGEIEIHGAAREFTRAWSKELVVYLAMHPNGASNEAWATALWPDRLMAPSSLHSTASVARRALGQARSGADHLPRSHGRLALSGSVGTDWARFVAYAEINDARSWRTALELVRGRPFEGLRSSDWPILEGIGPAIEAAIVDLSGRLAGSCLATGNARGAEWAARRGLLVSPYDERLYRMLMRAADAGGNPAGVESVMSELVKLVANEIEPLESVHPSTMELYRSLTRRRNGSSNFL